MGCFWMGHFFPFLEGKRPRNRCTWLWGSSPMGEGGDLGVLAFRRYLYTTDQLERLAEEVKRRTKVVEVCFW